MELNNIVMRMEEVMSKIELPLPIVNKYHPLKFIRTWCQEFLSKARRKQDFPNLKVQEWQEFWDAFKSAMDQNESLTAVDKFAYLRSLVTELARAIIMGFSLTAVNYAAEL